MEKQKSSRPHVFFLERDSQQYPKEFPDTLPFPSDFLPENEFFKPKEVAVEWDFYTSKWVMSSMENLPVEDNQIILKKWLSAKKHSYEYDYDEGEGEYGYEETRRYTKKRRFSEIQKIKLKIERVICERVKGNRSK